MSFPEDIKVGDVCHWAKAWISHTRFGRRVYVDYYAFVVRKVTPKGARFLGRRQVGLLEFWRSAYGADPTCKPCDDKGTWYPFQSRTMHATKEGALEHLKLRTARRVMHNERRLADAKAIAEYLELGTQERPGLFDHIQTRSTP